MSDQNIAPAIHERKGHTPGPWHFITGHTTFSVRSSIGSICQLSWHSLTKNPAITFEERRANARLIAAAPELLECARRLAALEGDGGGRTFPTKEDCAFARVAIAKAEG